MDLARDVGALFLAHLLKPGGERAKLLAREMKLLACVVLRRDVALDAEVAGDASALIVDHHVVTLDAHGVPSSRRSSVSVCTCPAIEELAPSRLALGRSCAKNCAGVRPDSSRGVEH